MTPTKTSTKPTDGPQIVTVEEMPKPKRGRQPSIDLQPLIDLLGDNKNHAIEEVNDKPAREKWARHLRQAAKAAGLEVETTFSEAENRLYFRGWPEGNAPARGRRSKDTRK